MDAGDHGEAQQGVTEEGAKQPGIRKRPPGAGERGGDHARAPSRTVDRDGDPFAGRHDPELVAHVHVEEGRHVEDLRAALDDRGVGIGFDGNDVGVALAERVADGVEHCRERTVGAMTEVDAQRIERETKDARQRQEAYRAVVHGDPGAGELFAHHGAQGRALWRSLRQMIAIVKGKEVPAIA